MEVRSTLLALAREFVSSARQCVGVTRIALIGSILTPKPRPKDIDLLVGITDTVDLEMLAVLGRRLKGTAQSRLNSGADVFLARNSQYLGRVCHFRECHRRVLCRARHCGALPHVADDLDVVTLDSSLIVSPPVEVWPMVALRIAVPEDVERLFVGPLRSTITATAVRAE